MTATARKLDYDEHDESIIVVRRPSSHRKTRAASTARPKLLPEREPATAGRRLPNLGVFAVVCLAVLTAGMLGMLVVNTWLAQGAFTVNELNAQKTLLAEQEQQLSEDIAIASAPLQLETKARELGMVPQDSPAFLRLSDGAILGNAVPQPEPGTVDTANGEYVNGYLIDPTTGEVAIDPVTGEPISQDTEGATGIVTPPEQAVPSEGVDGTTGEDLIQDPNTGEWVDPVTGLPPVDPVTGEVIDPSQGGTLIRDPNTGEWVDPVTGLPPVSDPAPADPAPADPAPVEGGTTDPGTVTPTDPGTVTPTDGEGTAP